MVSLDRFLKLYHQGLDDQTIKTRFGCSLRTVERLRKKNNLPPQSKRFAETNTLTYTKTRHLGMINE